MSAPKTIAQLLCVLILALFAQFAAAQGSPSYGPSVGIDDAKKMAAAALAEAKKNNWNMAIAIVDNHGFLVYFEKMDDTQTASVRVAIDKAKSSAIYRRPTRAFEEGVAKGRVALLGLTGATPITGGVPIMKGGKVLGGIGVSGAAADQDEQVAKAGLGAL
jgi:uncharacterized protein GlcG (DUF336 family)